MDDTERMYPWTDKLPQDSSLELSWTKPKEDVRNDRSRSEPAAYPTTRTLAYCARLAYKDDADKSLDITKELQGWQVLVKGTSSRGYHGLGLWHPIHKQLVIAHRGTKIRNVGSLWADVQGVLLNKLKEKFIHAAVTFTYSVLEEMRNSAENVFMVGHSLGGWLTAVSTYSAQYLTLVEKYFVYNRQDGGCIRPHSATFDAPGSKEILTKLQDACELRLSESDSLRELDITNYVSAPSCINTQNLHVGVLIRVFNTSSHTTSEHGISSFFSLFDDKGEIKEEMVRVFDWPIFEVSGKELSRFKKYTNPDTGKSKDAQKCPKGYNPMRYSTKTYTERQCSLIVLRPEAREFLNMYTNMQKSPHHFLKELKSVESVLANCKVSKGVLSCESPKEIREFIPKINRICQDNLGITFKLLTEKNINILKQSTSVQYDNADLPRQLQSNRNINIVCEDNVEIALQRLLQTKTWTDKEVLVFTQDDLKSINQCERTTELIQKNPDKFVIILGCTVDMSQEMFTDDYKMLEELGSSFWTISNRKSNISQYCNNYIEWKKTEWSNLSKATQQDVMSRKLIVFQENSELVSMRDILPNAVDDFLQMRDVIDAESLEKLLKNQFVHLLKAPAAPPSVYVTRKLQLCELNGKRLKERCFLFAYTCWIRGITEADLSQRYDIEEKETSKFRFVSDFPARCVPGYDLFIEYSSITKSLLLVKGQSDKLNKYIKECSISESNFAERSEYPSEVLICGDPGVGKSTVLKSIATNIKLKNPYSWVLLLNLNDHTNSFLKYKDQRNYTYDNLVEFLAVDLLKLDGFEKNMLGYVLQQPHADITIALDSVDEVSPTYMELVLSFVSALKQLTNVRLLILSTRNHLRKEMETRLMAPSLSLTNFDKDEKATFVELNFKNSENLNHIQGILGKMNTKDGITNNPLILTMLSDVTGQDNLAIESICGLYDDFVRRKCDVYRSKSGDSRGNVQSTDQYESFMKEASTYHENLGRSILCPQFTLEDLRDEKVESRMLKIGLVVRTGGAIRFVHFSFAEYFFAKWVHTVLHQEKIHKNLDKCIFKEILVADMYKNVRVLLNDLIKLKKEKVMRVRIGFKNSHWNSDIPPFLKTAVEESHLEILKYFRDRFGKDAMVLLSVEKKKGLKTKTILNIAVENQNIEVFKYLHTNFPQEILDEHGWHWKFDATGLYMYMYSESMKKNNNIMDDDPLWY